MSVFTTQFQAWVRRLALRVAARLRSLPVTPNQLTITGLLVTLVAAALIGADHPFIGGMVLLFAGVFDIFDGALARASNRSYPYGAFLDSTTDRISEGAVLVGVLLYFQHHQMYLGPVLVVLTLLGSLMVSYVRARAQSLGFTCEGGPAGAPRARPADGAGVAAHAVQHQRPAGGRDDPGGLHQPHRPPAHVHRLASIPRSDATGDREPRVSPAARGRRGGPPGAPRGSTRS